MGLPTDDKGRKGLPVFRGPLMYFPDAVLAIAAVCKAGNDQHNPGEPLHWAREKSTEQMDTALRHMMDHGLGNTRDGDGTYHLAKAAWRLMAELQLAIERDRANETERQRLTVCYPPIESVQLSGIVERNVSKALDDEAPRPEDGPDLVVSRVHRIDPADVAETDEERAWFKPEDKFDRERAARDADDAKMGPTWPRGVRL